MVLEAICQWNLDLTLLHRKVVKQNLHMLVCRIEAVLLHQANLLGFGATEVGLIQIVGALIATI